MIEPQEIAIELFVFHRAMRCADCFYKHQPGEVTHSFRLTAVVLLICNGCHAAQWTWIISFDA